MSQITSLRQALTVSPDNVPLLLLLGEACLNEFAFDEARTTFSRASQLEPANPAAKLGIARALYLTGQISEAVVRLESMLTADPGYAPAWVLAARLALGEGRRDDANEYYRKALAIDGTAA